MWLCHWLPSAGVRPGQEVGQLCPLYTPARNLQTAAWEGLSPSAPPEPGWVFCILTLLSRSEESGARLPRFTNNILVIVTLQTNTVPPTRAQSGGLGGKGMRIPEASPAVTAARSLTGVNACVAHRSLHRRPHRALARHTADRSLSSVPWVGRVVLPWSRTVAVAASSRRGGWRRARRGLLPLVVQSPRTWQSRGAGGGSYKPLVPAPFS